MKSKELQIKKILDLEQKVIVQSKKIEELQQNERSFRINTERLQTMNNCLKSDINELQHKKDFLSTKLAECELAFANEKEISNRLASEKSTINNLLQSTKSELIDCKNEIRRIDEALSQKEDEVEKLKYQYSNEKNKTKEKYKALESEKTELSNQIAEACELMRNQKELISSKDKLIEDKDREITTKENLIEQLRNELQCKLSIVPDMEKTINDKNIVLAVKDATIASHVNMIEKQKEELDRNYENLENLTDKINKLNLQKNDLLLTINEKETENLQLKNELEQKEIDLRETKNLLNNEKNGIKDLLSTKEEQVIKQDEQIIQLKELINEKENLINNKDTLLETKDQEIYILKLELQGLRPYLPLIEEQKMKEIQLALEGAKSVLTDKLLEAENSIESISHLEIAAVLKTSIGVAKAILDEADTTKEQIDDATTQLNDAIRTAIENESKKREEEDIVEQAKKELETKIEEISTHRNEIPYDDVAGILLLAIDKAHSICNNEELTVELIKSEIQDLNIAYENAKEEARRREEVKSINTEPEDVYSIETKTTNSVDISESLQSIEEQNFDETVVGEESEEYQYQYLVKRTIVDLVDVETGETVNADDILNYDATNKAIFQKMRESLIVGQRKGIYKYVCEFCTQPVRLTSRKIPGTHRISNFFQHFSYSSDCPVKTVSSYSPESWSKIWMNKFRESELYRTMFKSLKSILKIDSDFFELTTKSKGGEHDLTVLYKDNQIAIDLQLYSTYISKILDLRAGENMFGFWLFPYFSPVQQEMCARDIYYAHKRNVFVFDLPSYYSSTLDATSIYKPPFPQIPNYKYAQEESLQRGELMLNCFWQVPVKEGNKLIIKWYHKLISFSELSFDPDSKSIFYHDSDKDFYDNWSPEVQQMIDHWEEELKKRWKEKERAIALRIEASEEKTKEKVDKTALQLNKLKDRIVTGEMVESFYDEGEKKYGFKIGEEVIVKPKYAEVKNFDINGIAIVKQSSGGNYGSINLLGKKVFPFQFSSIEHVEGKIYAVRKGRTIGFMTIGQEILIPCDYYSYKYVGNHRVILNTSSEEYERYISHYDYYGNPVYKGDWSLHKGYEYLYDLEGDRLSDGYDNIEIINESYLIAKDSTKTVLLDRDGLVVKTNFMGEKYKTINEKNITDIANNKVFYSTNNNHVAVYDLDGNLIFSSELYDTIRPCDNDVYIVSNRFGQGYITTSGTIIEQEAVYLSNGYSKRQTIGWKIFRRDGSLLNTRTYSAVDDYRDGIIVVRGKDWHNTERYYFLNEEGDVIKFPNGLQKIDLLSNGCYRINQDGKIGIMNSSVDFWILECIYSKIEWDGNLYHLIIDNELKGKAREDGSFLGENRTQLIGEVYKSQLFGKWGITDIEGHQSRFIYDEITVLDNRFILAHSIYARSYWGINDEYVSCFNKKGHLLIDGYGTYEDIQLCTPHLLLCKNTDGLYSLYKEDGSILFNELSECSSLDSGCLAIICKSDYSQKKGVIDRDGRNVIETEYDEIIWDGNRYKVELRGSEGYYEANGQRIISIETFENGYKKQRFIYSQLLDKEGNRVNDQDYKEILQLDEERFIVETLDSRWGIIGINGNSLLESKYDDIKKLSDHFIWAYVNNRHSSFPIGVLCKYKSLFVILKGSFSIDYLEDSYYLLVRSQNKLSNIERGIINSSGNIVIPFDNYSSLTYNDNHFILEQNGHIWHLECDGVTEIASEVIHLNEHLNFVRMRTGWGLQESNGTLITDGYSYDSMEKVSDNLIKICKNRNWGLMNLKGEVVLECNFKSIQKDEGSSLQVSKNGYTYYKLDENYRPLPIISELEHEIKIEELFGEKKLIDREGKQIGEVKFREIKAVSEGCFIVLNQNWGVINSAGVKLIDYKYNKIEEIKPYHFKVYWEVTKKHDYIKYGRWRSSFRTINKSKIISCKKMSTLFNFVMDEIYTGTITNIKKYGIFVEIENVGIALCHISEIEKSGKQVSDFEIGNIVEVKVINIDDEKKRASLTLIINQE